jgi:threonine dehydratase
VALAVKTLKPECKVIGVEPKNCRSLEVLLGDPEELRHG